MRKAVYCMPIQRVSNELTSTSRPALCNRNIIWASESQMQAKDAILQFLVATFKKTKGWNLF